MKFSDYPCVCTICHPVSCDIILSVTLLSVILLSVMLSIYHTYIDSIIMYRTHIRTRIYRHHYIPQTSLYSSTYSPVCGGCSRISYHTYSFASQHSFASHAFIHIIHIHPDHIYYSHPTYSHEFIRTPSSASYALIRITRIHPHHIHSFAHTHLFARHAFIHPTCIQPHLTHSSTLRMMHALAWAYKQQQAHV